MKKRLLCVYIIFLALPFCLFGCNWGARQIDEIPDGLQFYVENLPAITDFSGAEYGDYKYHFPPVTEAVFYHDGMEESIAPNDPRLIRLLNFFAYSESEMCSAWRQGFVYNDEIEQNLSVDVPMLEVSFDNTGCPDSSAISDAYRIMICGNEYLIFLEPGTYSSEIEEGQLALEHFPYMSLILEMCDEGKLDESAYRSNGWGKENWIDLLVYAGFGQTAEKDPIS